MKCPKCGSNLKIKLGKYGKFYGCSNYPKCTFTQKFNDGPICPYCKRKLILKDGINGKFYSCPNFPKCNYSQNI